MPSPAIVFLMYHELELPGRSLVQSEPGYVRYIVTREDFRTQMTWLRENGWIGLSVSEALAYPSGKSVAITFDDGCETDLITAAPILQDAGYHATFYVTTGFLDKPGYLSSDQLRQLSGAGFEIGCHSMTHPYLNDLDDSGLHREIVEARMKLEQLIGKRVEHFSCPGGRYDERTIALAKETGYRSLATSRVQSNSPATDPFSLGRVVVMRGTNASTFSHLCSGTGLWKIRFAGTLRSSVRNALGNRIYDVLRTRVLR